MSPLGCIPACIMAICRAALMSALMRRLRMLRGERVPPIWSSSSPLPAPKGPLWGPLWGPLCDALGIGCARAPGPALLSMLLWENRGEVAAAGQERRLRPVIWPV